MPAPNRSSRRLALLGRDSDAATIGRICDEQEFGVEAYEDVEALLSGSPPARCVVLRAKKSELASATIEIARLTAATAAPVVVVCETLRSWELRGLLEAGASGVILESELDSAFGPCIQAALAGQVCVPRDHSSQVVPQALSAREKQVLGLVVMGHTNGEIADRLFLAESTVKSHLSSAFGKLGVRSRNEAVELILDSERGPGLGILGLSVEQVV